MRYFILCILCCWATLGNAQKLNPIHYQDKQTQLQGLITDNVSADKPAVLILPAWKGIDNESRDAALALAQEGYIVFIADIYGVNQIPTTNEAASKMSGFYKQSYNDYQHRIQLALDQLNSRIGKDQKIAIIGYCFGGTGALEAARGQLNVAGVVSIHGGLARDSKREIKPIKTKVLIEHPANDKSVTKQDYDNIINELNQGNADWQIITYANCGHTFTNPESADYNPTMATRAWKHTLLFLSEVLK